MQLIKAVIIVIFLLSTLTLNSQEAPFSRGVNLSNWLQAGSPEQVQFNKYNLQDFQQIKSLGCDVIRIPVNLFGMTTGEPSYTIKPLFYTLLDSISNWAEEADIHVILDNHSFEPSVINGNDNGVFLSKVWPQIAYRYKGAYEKLYFEILNEPHDISDAKWNQIQIESIEKIRQIDPDRWIIVGPASWNSFHNLENMPDYPFDKLIYTFHFYDPFIFTHQGASWVDPSMSPLQGVPFPYNPSEMPTMPASFAGSWLASAFNNYSNEGNIYNVRQLLNKAIDFKNSRNVPIYCGEFGVLINYADDNDRSFWYETVRRHLEENGVAWTIWDYHGGFGLFEKGSEGLFNHDLNIGLLEKLGLIIPDQTEFEIIPDSSNLVIYDDYIGKNIYEASNTSGSLSMTHSNSLTGDFCIQWENPGQYNQIGFDFRPNRDLSSLQMNDYALEFWIRGDRPGAQLDIRFVDSKTGENGDRPWRIRFIIDENIVTWDGSWQKLSIPLKEFVEHGSWDDNTWFEPIGAFDWTEIDLFEIVDEYGIQNPAIFGFDEIVIRGEALNTNDLPDQNVLIFPLPANEQITIQGNSFDIGSWEIIDLKGETLMKNSNFHNKSIDISTLNAGLYVIKLNDRNKGSISKKFIKN